MSFGLVKEIAGLGPVSRAGPVEGIGGRLVCALSVADRPGWHRITHKHGRRTSRLAVSGVVPGDGLRVVSGARGLSRSASARWCSTWPVASLRVLFVSTEGETLVPVHGNSPTPGVDRSPVRVWVGIDAAVVANHSVCVRQVGADGAVSATRFQVPPTLAGVAL